MNDWGFYGSFMLNYSSFAPNNLLGKKKFKNLDKTQDTKLDSTSRIKLNFHLVLALNK